MENKFKEVDISYTYDFPIEAVFDAWINPEYLPLWFAPHGCTIEFKKLDLRKGGSYHHVIRNPKFGDCWVVGTYYEIEAPHKLVFSMVNADENGKIIDPTQIGMHPDWPGKTMVRITFSEVNGKTTVNLKQTAPEVVAKKTGAYQSWLEMFERSQLFIKELTTQQ